MGGILISKNDDEPLYIQNVVCRIGRERLASQAANNALTNSWFSHLVVGEGILAASTEDLSLADELYRVKFDSVFATNYTIFGAVDLTGLMIDNYVGVVPGVGEYDITEFGLMNALAGGDLICHQTPDYCFTITGDDKLSVLWGVTVT